MATIVTCYYLIDKSKHTPSEYKIWINNLISNLKNVNIVIFTCAKDRSQIDEIVTKNRQQISRLGTNVNHVIMST